MTKEKYNPHISNPLDELFNTEPTKVDEDEYEQVTEGELAAMAAPVEPGEPEEKDAEDIEIDKKVDQIYDMAVGAFQELTAYTQIIEPRYAARNAEVAANYLSTALNAASVRAKVKGDRKRAAQFVPFAQKNQSNVVVASREEIMRMISIDAEVKELK